MTLKHIPLRLIGFLVLAYVLYVVDLAAVWSQVRRIGVVSIMAASAAFVVLLCARCIRWHLLVRCTDRSRSFAQNFSSCNESVWIGMATPGRVGEFSRGLDLTRSGGPSIVEASMLVVFDLLLDLFAYASFALAGVVLLLLHDRTNVAPLAYAACVIAAFALLTRLRTLIALGTRWFPRLARIPGAGILAALSSGLEPRAVWGVAATTAAAFVAYSLMIAALTAPMNLNLDPAGTFTMVGLVGVSGAIPITYFGFGTREVALIWYFDQIGLDKELAVAVSFSFLIAQLIGIAVSLALALMLRVAQRFGAFGR